MHNITKLVPIILEQNLLDYIYGPHNRRLCFYSLTPSPVLGRDFSEDQTIVEDFQTLPLNFPPCII